MKRQQGYILLAMLAVLLALGAVWTVRAVNAPLQDYAQRSASDLRSRQLEALEEARMRLIDRAVFGGASQAANPGAMPCPDTDNNGYGADKDPPNANLGGWGLACSPTEAQTAGRFPYKDLPALTLSYETLKAQGLSDVEIAKIRTPAALDYAEKSEDRECIWYAVGPVFRSMDTSERLKNTGDKAPINPDTKSVIQVNGKPVMALLIAPGLPLLEQAKSRTSGAPCKGGPASAFLGSLGDINNAATKSDGSMSYYADTAAVTAINTASSKCVARSSITDSSKIGAECGNDVILPVTRADIMKPLLRKVLEQLANEVKTDSNTAIPPITGCSAGSLKAIDKALPTTGSGTLASLRNANPPCFDFTVFSGMTVATDSSGKLQLLTAMSDVYKSSGCYDSGTTSTPLWLCANDWYRFIAYDNSGSVPILSIKLDATDANSYRCSITLSRDSNGLPVLPRKAVCQ